MLSRRTSVPLTAALFLAAAGTSGATTYRMVAEADLVDQAAVVVQARVASVEPAPVLGTPATDYLVEVERLLKGDLSGSAVVVRVPGGVGPTGLGLKLWGVPELAEDERALLFLRPGPDGTYRVLHLMLGAFRERFLAGRRLALRNLDETAEVTDKGLVPGGENAARDFERFADWIADRASGLPADDDYKGEAIAAKYALIDSKLGNNIRWFDFDHGRNVHWQVHESGLPRLGLGRTVEALGAAMAAWNADEETPVSLVYLGTTASSRGFTRSDGENVVLFGDPNNEVEGSFSCGRGGILALGGPFFTTATKTYRGRAYHEAVEGEVITNDGTDCYFDDPRATEEVFAHELGHTLGLGHSEVRGALMFARVHDDGRGARLSADDHLGLDVLYDDGVRSSGAAASPPAAPRKLRAVATGSRRVELRWRDKSANEDGFVIELREGRGRFREVAATAAGATAFAVEGLSPNTAYAFRVRAVNTGGASAYSNTARVRTPR
jgi:hypothetical protein